MSTLMSMNEELLHIRNTIPMAIPINCETIQFINITAQLFIVELNETLKEITSPTIPPCWPSN